MAKQEPVEKTVRNIRRHSSPGFLSPAEFERQYFASLS